MVFLLKFFDLNLTMRKLTHLECLWYFVGQLDRSVKGSQCSDRQRKVVDGTELGENILDWHMQCMNFEWIGGGNSCKGGLGDK